MHGRRVLKIIDTGRLPKDPALHGTVSHPL